MTTPIPTTPRAAPPTPATIFVADDDDDLRAALRIAFESEGFQVVEASNGDEALDALMAMTVGPDVLLLDFCMPGFSGLGVLRLLHRLGRSPPTLIMTALRDDSVTTFAERFGAIRVLYKPLELDELCTAVRAAASGPPSGQAA